MTNVEDEIRSNVIRRLEAGHTLDRIASLEGIERRRVGQIAHGAGYKIKSNGTAEKMTKPQPVPVAYPTAAVTETLTPPKQPIPPNGGRYITQYLDHENARIRKAAAAAKTKFDVLQGLVTDWDAKVAEREAAAAKKQAARDEIDRLEKKLKELKASIGGGGKYGKDHNASKETKNDNQLIRTWAAENGVECPRVGRVPKHVRDLFVADQADAHPQVT